MVPDMQSEHSPSVTEDKLAGLGAAIVSETTCEMIIERATMIFNWLRSLTDQLVSYSRELSMTMIYVEKNDVNIYKSNLIQIEVCCSLYIKFMY